MMAESNSSPPTPPSPENPQNSPPPAGQPQTGQPQVSLFAEFYEFLFHNAGFWVAPLVLVLALLGVLVWLTSGGVAPFIYSMF